MLQGNSCQSGHYRGVKLFNNHFLGNINIDSFKVKTELNDIVMFDKTDLNIMILNARSINNYLKKLLIIDLLRSKNIDIALIQETFLIKGDKLYFSGYKIYRDENNFSRRKGTAILVNSPLALNVIELLQILKED